MSLKIYLLNLIVEIMCNLRVQLDYWILKINKIHFLGLNKFLSDVIIFIDLLYSRSRL